MSVSSEITRLENAKTAIKTAIKGKGVAVPDETKVDGLATLIDDIYSGAYNIVSTANSDGTQNLEITDSVGGTITKELLASLDSDFVAENIKKDVDLFGLLGTLEGEGGGSSWTDSYSVFATGTFTPVESATEWTIDTGVPFDSANGTDYRRQILIGYREPSTQYTASAGQLFWLWRNISASFDGDNVVFCAVGFPAGISASKFLKGSALPFPNEGETTWTITGLSTSINFRANRTHRWILLGAVE